MCAAAGHGDCSCFGGGGSREVHNISVRVPRFSLLGAFVVFFHGRSCGGAFPRSLYESNMQVEP